MATMLNSTVLVSVATVVNNDAATVDAFVASALATLQANFEHFELVLVDNGSTDGSANSIRNLLAQHRNVRLIVLSKQYDEEVACTAALESCIGDFVVLMNLNEDPTELIPQMVQLCMNGSDVVIGDTQVGEPVSFPYRLASSFYYRLIKWFTGLDVRNRWYTFICFSRKVVNYVVEIRDRNRYLKFLKLETRLCRTHLPYKKVYRTSKRRDPDLLKRLYLGLEITNSNSIRLIKVASLLGFTTSFINVLYILYVLLVFIFKPDVAEGWTTTNLVTAGMFALAFFILAIQCEYVAYVFQQTRQGPLYHVSDEASSTVLFVNPERRNVL